MISIGLELALRHSREKEILKAKCTWKFGFGLYGRPAGANFSAVPEKSDLYFDIEILEVNTFINSISNYY